VFALTNQGSLHPKTAKYELCGCPDTLTGVLDALRRINLYSEAMKLFFRNSADDDN
jgi:hypothetical protein